MSQLAPNPDSAGLTGGRGVSRRSSWIFLLILAGVAFGLYANSLTGAFVEDDYIRWQDTDWIEGKSVPTILHDLFAPGRLRFYRPIPYLLHVIDYRLWGLNPVGFHVTNIILNVLAVVLAYFVAASVLGSAAGGFVAALLFAAHPAHTEAVAFIGGRTDLVMAIFFFLAVLLYIRFSRMAGRHRYLYYGGSVLAFVLALMSKEAAIALPLVLILCEVYFREPGGGGWVRRLVYPLAPGAIIVGLYLSLNLSIYARTSLHLTRIGLWPQTLTAIRTIYRYLHILIYPAKLVIVPDFPWSQSVTAPSAAVPLLGTVGLLAAIMLGLRLNKTISFGLGWVLLSVLPISNLIALTEQPLIGDRYLYVPSLGFCMVLGYLLSKLLMMPSEARRAGLHRRLGMMALAAILIPYSTLTVRRNQDWRSEQTLASRAMEQEPGSARPRAKLGGVYLDEGKYEEAIQKYTEAIERNPNEKVAYHNLGLAYKEKGDYDKAVANLKKAIEIDPTLVEAHYNLGLVYSEMGRLDDGVDEYKKALALSPDYEEAHNALGSAYEKLGRLDDAIREYEKAVTLDSHYADALHNLGLAYSSAGRLNSAVEAYKKALEARPDYVEAHLNLGIAYMRMGLTDLAIAEYRNALNINPRYAEARNNLGNAYLATGRVEQAIPEYEAALEINPDYTDARVNLGMALMRAGRLDEALAEYRSILAEEPDNAEAHNNLGIALLRKGLVDEALGEYRQALTLKPDYAEAHVNLGNVYLRKGLVPEAIAEYEEAVGIAPTIVEAHFNLGIALSRQGKFEDAIAEYQEVLKLNPNSADAHAHLAAIYSQLGDYQLAIEHCDRALQLGGRVDPKLLDLLRHHRGEDR